MKQVKLVVVVMLLFVGINHVKAQVPTTQSLPDTAQMAYNQISKSSGLYVFPSNDQSQQQQKEDEFECYLWAMDQSGIDPLDLPTIEVEVQSGATGGAVKGAAGGAAKGALIGAAAGDAGKGAAIGATAGGLRGVKRGQQGQAQANQQAEAEALAAEQGMKDEFMKAFSVCIEGKGYTVK